MSETPRGLNSKKLVVGRSLGSKCSDCCATRGGNSSLRTRSGLGGVLKFWLLYATVRTTLEGLKNLHGQVGRRHEAYH